VEDGRGSLYLGLASLTLGGLAALAALETGFWRSFLIALLSVMVVVSGVWLLADHLARRLWRAWIGETQPKATHRVEGDGRLTLLLKIPDLYVNTVGCFVRAPSKKWASVPVPMGNDVETCSISYPDAFPTGPDSLESGRYRVVWSAVLTHGNQGAVKVARHSFEVKDGVIPLT
jgi:hypothetical protein